MVVQLVCILVQFKYSSLVSIYSSKTVIGSVAAEELVPNAVMREAIVSKYNSLVRRIEVQFEGFSLVPNAVMRVPKSNEIIVVYIGNYYLHGTPGSKRRHESLCHGLAKEQRILFCVIPVDSCLHVKIKCKIKLNLRYYLHRILLFTQDIIIYIGPHLTWNTWEDEECVQEIYIFIYIGYYYLNRNLLFTWDTWEDEEGVQGDAQDH